MKSELKLTFLAFHQRKWLSGKCCFQEKECWNVGTQSMGISVCVIWYHNFLFSFHFFLGWGGISFFCFLFFPFSLCFWICYNRDFKIQQHRRQRSNVMAKERLGVERSPRSWKIYIKSGVVDVTPTSVCDIVDMCNVLFPVFPRPWRWHRHRRCSILKSLI